MPAEPSISYLRPTQGGGRRSGFRGTSVVLCSGGFLAFAGGFFAAFEVFLVFLASLDFLVPLAFKLGNTSLQWLWGCAERVEGVAGGVLFLPHPRAPCLLPSPRPPALEELV